MLPKRFQNHRFIAGRGRQTVAEILGCYNTNKYFYTVFSLLEIEGDYVWPFCRYFLVIITGGPILPCVINYVISLFK
jgi:hypothetical protein